jgi:hypothetical protein
MRTSKAFIAAVPLALALMAAVLVTVALTAASGTFGFDSWPISPSAPPRANAVVIDQPLELSARARSVVPSRPPVVRDDAAGSSTRAHGALVAQVETRAPREISKVPSGNAGSRHVGSGAGTTTDGTGDPAPGALVEDVPTTDSPSPAPAPTPVPVPGTVAVDPEPPSADPIGGVEARPAAPTEISEAPVAEQPDEDSAWDGEPHGDDSNRPDWLLPDISESRGRGRGHGHGRGHRAH